MEKKLLEKLIEVLEKKYINEKDKCTKYLPICPRCHSRVLVGMLYHQSLLLDRIIKI